MDDLEPGTILNGRYCVERLFARGGMSRLYQGHPLDGAGRVAIKQLDVPEHGTVTREDLAQFRKEHDILHSLDHPGLARALDFFTEDGRHYLVEEFVPGDTLDVHLQRAGRLPHEEAVLIMDQVLGILEHLHRHQVVYRDLKPHNVILQPRAYEEGVGPGSASLPYRVRLVDFGAARRWKQGATRDTVPLGTPGFAPPEQYGRAQSDARSDVYSAGVLLHCMLTGRLPEPVPGRILDAPHWTVPDVPPELGRAVLQAVESDPRWRFQDAAEMRTVLMRVVGRLNECPRCGTPLSAAGPACGTCFARSAILVTVYSALALAAMVLAGIFLG